MEKLCVRQVFKSLLAISNHIDQGLMLRYRCPMTHRCCFSGLLENRTANPSLVTASNTPPPLFPLSVSEQRRPHGR